MNNKTEMKRVACNWKESMAEMATEMNPVQIDNVTSTSWHLQICVSLTIHLEFLDGSFWDA